MFLSQQLLSISSVLVLLVLAMFLAIGLNPTVEWFMKNGMRRGLSVLLVLFVVITVLVLFVVAVAPVISEQIAKITENAPGWLEDLQRNNRVQSLDDRFDVIHKVQDYVTKGDFGQRVFGGALGVGLAVLSALANALIVIVLMVYFLATLPSIKHAAYSLAPASKRPRVSELGDRIIRSTGSYVAGAFLVSVCAGISTLIFTFVVGLGDYAFALAFIVGLLSLVPVVGAVVSGDHHHRARAHRVTDDRARDGRLLHRLPAGRVLLHLPAHHEALGRHPRVGHGDRGAASAAA